MYVNVTFKLVSENYLILLNGVGMWEEWGFMWVKEIDSKSTKTIWDAWILDEILCVAAREYN